ncbi:Vitellogenin [Habropoda laboriosa]|uniref:Vitellogenin n=1 Tax=Habropoda laboriosa TaxID=597456 RepID=A0A0L7R6M9_9HYME|nr:Vitellogenin [Habropoda laboriosa]
MRLSCIIVAHFPHGKTVTYKYRADAKAGMMNPAPFASQFGIEGLLHVKHDVTDPTLRHAYYVALTDVKHALHNGHNIDHLSVTQPIHDLSKDIEIPFLIVYDEVGHFQGMKLKEGESTWSQNIKKSIGSMLQLDLSKIHVQTPMEHHSFITHEETIHGNCQVAYNVHTKDQMHPTSGNVFVVKKIHEPMNCTHFTHQVFNHVEPEKCYVEEEEGMTTASKRVFEIEDQGNEILIRKLIGHGVINYFPWMAQSEAHYILTNQTLILDNVATVNEVQLPVVDFQNVPITREMFFTKPQTQYVPQADVDITQGRHVVNLNDLTAKLRKMLDEAAGYLKESHIEKRQPDWKHGQTINRLLHVMSFMNVESLKQVFSELQNTKDPKEIVMRNIFLEIMPNVGTTAACLFTRNVVRQKMVPDMIARFMLAHLPMHVKVPSTELLLQMEELLHLGDSVNSGVKEASILCFASLVHRTFKTLSPNDLLLKRYLQLFMEHIKNEPTYQMKALYLMAMKNVRLINILNVLEPIVKGEVMYSEKPASIRLLAIWAIQNVVVHHPDYAYRLLWPILSDVTLPLAMRIVSYDVLMHQLPHAGRLMSIYWFMVNEKDEHLYNYHVETIKGLANSVEPCLTPVCEMARKMLPFTRIRQVVGPLSTKVHVDYKDTKYGHGEAVKASLILHQSTGYPYVGSVEHFTTVARKPVSQWGLQWHIENLSGVVNSVKNEMTGKNVQKITRDNVREVLATAAADMPKMKDVNIHVVLTKNHNVVFVYHINSHQWLSVLKHLKEWKQFFVKQTEIINLQTIAYMNLFEMHVPTDLGVPAVLTTRIPSFNSLKLNAFLSEDENLLSLKLKAKFMRWMHGEYAMTIYNPISDVWHSTRRTMSEDVLLPLEMNVGYNRETKSLKVSVPRLPFTEYSAAGILTSAKSYVTIAHDESDLLKDSCDTCRHQELVTKVVNPKINEHTYDSKDTGLKFTMAVFDCEGTATPVSPISEWLDVLRVENKNTMGYKLVQLIMGVRQSMMNNVISGQGKSCSNLIRIEPSLVYPTSAVDLTTKVTTQDLDSSHETLHFFSNKRISVRVTMDAKAASTNESVKLWDMNMHIVLSQEHVNNSMNVVVTRTTPGEKNLKICMEAVKDYKSTTTDLLNVDIGQKETNTKVTVTMGQTQGEQCVRDEMDVVLNIKGEVSEEQQKHIVQDREHSMCTQHMQNPLYQGSHVPKTWDCIQQALLHSSLRKYTTSMTMRRVPPLVVSTVNIMQDVLRGLSFPYVHYSLNHADSGNMNMVMEYPYLTDVLDATVITPTYSYELVNLPFGHNIWNILMDNSHYSVTDLYKFVNGYTKACTIYPQVVLTFDNGTIPYVVPDKWTLISGDHVDHTYSVFVKLVQNNKLAMKFFVGPHEMTVMPGDTGEMVSVNNNVIENHRKGVMVPENTPDSYAIRLTRAYSHLMIDSKVVPVQVYCAPNSVSVLLETVLQGQVTGMCGHMDGTHESVLPKIYSVLHL